jgi:hypothetical protein
MPALKATNERPLSHDEQDEQKREDTWFCVNEFGIEVM